MREIKFRAWDSGNGEYYTDCGGISTIYFWGGVAQSRKTLVGLDFEQFTGKLDKDGVEIYQGDKLSLNYGMPPTIAKFVVEWVDDYEVFEHDCCSYFACGWVMRSIGVEPSAMLTTHYLQDITIIGNIHDQED